MQTGRKKSDQPFILELPGKTAKQERYATLRTACKGAVRAHKEWLLVDAYERCVKINNLPSRAILCRIRAINDRGSWHPIRR